MTSKRITRRAAVATMAAVGGAAALPAISRRAKAQSGPIKIGLTMAQTGGLAAGGKSSLLGMQIWRDDINAKGGLLGRQVEFVVYDDKSSATESAALYAKLLDVDKVDLLYGPYGTVPNAPVMPMVKQRGLMLLGNFAYQGNNVVKHDMWFNIAPWGPADSWSRGFIDIGQNVGAKSIALLAADQEFAQNLVKIAKGLAEDRKIPIVYEQNYPPTTVEFSAMLRALKSAKPDMVFVCAYPPDATGIMRAVNEVGVGDSVKIFGGGMVGLQFGTVMEQLGSLLNGVVNYNSLVPEKSQEFSGTKDFLDRYAKRAVVAKVDPLGFYLAPYGYALGELVASAVNATKSLDHKQLAQYIRSNEHSTIVGKFKFAADGEWAESGTVQAQFRGIVDKNIEQFRQPGKQVILYPDRLKSGEVIVPFEKARKA